MREIEERACSAAEVKAGITIRAGHAVVLIVDGMVGTPVRRPDTSEDDDGEAEDASAGPPGTPAGDPDAEYAIEVQLIAKGGTPLAAEQVRIVDPDTGAAVGKPGVTDEQGVLRGRVPEQKEYQFFVDHRGGEDDQNPWTGLDRAPSVKNDHPMLHVRVVDATNQPVKGEKIRLTDEQGAATDAQTDDDGILHVAVEPGAFTLQARGKSLVVHSVFAGDVADGAAPYKFKLA